MHPQLVHQPSAPWPLDRRIHARMSNPTASPDGLDVRAAGPDLDIAGHRRELDLFLIVRVPRDVPALFALGATFVRGVEATSEIQAMVGYADRLEYIDLHLQWQGDDVDMELVVPPWRPLPRAVRTSRGRSSYHSACGS